MIEIYCDIETIRTSRADIQARVAQSVTPPGNYKKQDTIDAWWASEGEAKKQEAIARTALNGTWGEIVCIGVAINDEPAIVLTRESSEADLLSKFGQYVDNWAKDYVRSGDLWSSTALWIGHNLIDFDLRFLWQRQKVLGIKLPFDLPVGRGGTRVFDTMKEWAGYREMISQKDLELAFGLKRTDPLELGGAEVGQAYAEGRIADIAEHCRQDIELLRSIYRRMVA